MIRLHRRHFSKRFLLERNHCAQDYCAQDHCAPVSAAPVPEAGQSDSDQTDSMGSVHAVQTLDAAQPKILERADPRAIRSSIGGTACLQRLTAMAVQSGVWCVALLLGETSVGLPQPRVTWQRDRQGCSFYRIDDPISGSSHCFETAREARAWLETRYYR